MTVYVGSECDASMPNGTPVTSFTTRGNVQIEIPKKCTTTMTVYVGSGT